jgi:hypothetical protein
MFRAWILDVQSFARHAQRMTVDALRMARHAQSFKREVLRFRSDAQRFARHALRFTRHVLSTTFDALSINFPPVFATTVEIERNSVLPEFVGRLDERAEISRLHD